MNKTRQFVLYNRRTKMYWNGKDFAVPKNQALELNVMATRLLMAKHRHVSACTHAPVERKVVGND